MALTLGDLVAYLRVDDSDFTSKVNKSESRWSKLSSGMATGAKFIGAAAIGAIGAAGALGISTASQMEQANIGFTTMLGSAEKARKFLGDLQKFAASTPFEFPELQTAASSLISVGINADDVIPIMRTLGDVTSGMGTGSEGIQRATVALQQMTAAGKIQAEDLNQLRDAGIPVYDLLAAALGKTKAEVVDLAAGGKLGQDALDAMMKALESGAGLERFSGLMDKQSQSLEGLWSTVKDTFGQGMATAIAPLIPLIKTGLGGGISLLSGLMPTLAQGLQSVVGWISGLGDKLRGVYDLIVNGDFTAQLGQAFNIQEDNPVVGYVLDARNALLHAWDNLGNIWASLDVSGLGEKLKTAAITAGGDLFAGLATGLGTGDWSALGQAIIGAIGAALSGLGQLADTLFTGLSQMIGQVDWFGLAMKFGEQVPTLLAGLATGILNFDLGSLLEGLGDHWFEVLMAILALAFTPAKWIGKIGELLAKIPLVGSFLKWLLNASKGLADKAVGLAGDIIKGFGRGFTAGGSEIVGRVRGVFNTVRTTLVRWGDNIVAWFRGLPDRFVRIAETLGLNLRIKFDQAVAAVGRAVRNGFNAVLGWLRGLPGKVSGAVGGLGSALYNGGKALLQGLWNGMTGAAGWLWGKVRGWATGLLGKVKGIFEFGSPSRVFERYGGWLMQGMAQGIAGGSGHAVNAALSAAGQVGNALQVAPAAAGIGAAGATGRGFTASAPRTAVRVYIGDRELTDIVRVETGAHVDRQLGAVADQLHYAGA